MLRPGKASLSPLPTLSSPLAFAACRAVGLLLGAGGLGFQSCLTGLKCKQTFGTLAFWFCCLFCKRDGQGMGCRDKNLCLVPRDGEGWDSKLVLVHNPVPFSRLLSH